ncbi:hypothetical protein [Sediminimonas qiaohouensis]|uniref:hypothetical protein n=1 Tax=Sediminimonas qiaohouensis TaxID=552061 RepID=UPI0003FD30E0|nr:hypothetical protein [Sediminimonas qiaohouensis]
MSRSPIIAFGLQAQTVALKARTGQLQWRDQVDLAKSALEWVPEETLARDMVLDFLGHCRVTPGAAGQKLQHDLTLWLDEACPPDPGPVPDGIEAERGGVEFDWQKRADLQ